MPHFTWIDYTVFALFGVPVLVHITLREYAEIVESYHKMRLRIKRAPTTAQEELDSEK